MKLKFKKLVIDNFLSFGHAEVDLADRGYTLIEGINQNPKDGAKSNGAGKSTIFSALCYALTGETIQGLSSNLNNIFTNGDMRVTLIFSADNDEYEITRSRDSKNKADLKINVNGVDKSGKGVRESQEILDQLLPELTSDLIGEVIIIGQGMPHKFSNNTPSGRKDLLERLSHSDYMLEDIKERIEKRTDALKETQNKNTVEKTKLETIKTITEKQIGEKQNERLKYENKPNFQKQREDLKGQLGKIGSSIKRLQTQIDAENARLSEINGQILQVETDRNKQIADETAVFNQFNVKIKTELAEKKTQKRALEEEVKRLEAIKDVCPMCHQKLPHVHKQDTSTQKENIKLLAESITTLEEKDKQQNNSFNLNVEDIKNRFREKEIDLNKDKNASSLLLKGFQSQLTADTLAQNDLRVSLNTLEKEEQIFEENKAKCEESLKILEKTLSDTNAQILYIISKEEEVKAHQETIAKINTLVKRDFRGILLSNIIKYIDQKCKVYAKDIFGADELDFKLDGNNLNISYCKKPLEALSGGEQQKVDLIIQFAIRAMMQEYTGFTSNIIVLDEILDNLDSVGCDSILDFITNKLSDIESIFIISHHADTLNIGNDSTITVIKNQEGVSHIL